MLGHNQKMCVRFGFRTSGGLGSSKHYKWQLSRRVISSDHHHAKLAIWTAVFSIAAFNSAQYT